MNKHSINWIKFIQKLTKQPKRQDVREIWKRKEVGQ